MSSFSECEYEYRKISQVQVLKLKLEKDISTNLLQLKEWFYVRFILPDVLKRTFIV